LLKRRKLFDREHKIQAIKQVINGEKTMGQIAHEFGVLPSVVSRWRSEYLKKSDSAFSGGGITKIDPDEHFLLIKLLGEVAKERDILRKAIALLYKREGLKDDI
jgi:transposase-like protein